MFEQLASLLAGYFHQDWDLEFKDFYEVASHYATENDLSHVSITLGQLLLVAEYKDETKIEAFLLHASCYYRPGDGTLEKWLREFASAIAAAAHDQATSDADISSIRPLSTPPWQ